MSKKDYVALAKIVSENVLPLSATDRRQVMNAPQFTEDLSDFLQADNPQFDRRRFLAACGTHDA